MSQPLSVFIIALNEADRIAATIRSVRGIADEIIVVDSGSTDGTQGVAEAEGARVLFNAWPGYGPQKRFAEEQCKNHWLLNLDADEVLSDELQQEIRALFAVPPPHAGYYMNIRDVLPGAAPSRFGHITKAVRLYDKRQGRYSDSTVHDRVHFTSGTIGQLVAPVWHYSSRSIEHSIFKLNRYSSMQAADRVARGKKTKFLLPKLIIIMPAAFLKAYLLRGYIAQGVAGFITSIVYAFSRFARLAKMWEQERKS